MRLCSCAVALADALAGGSRLRRLSLARNGIRDAGGAAFAAAIGGSRPLTSLDLSGNRCGWGLGNNFRFPKKSKTRSNTVKTLKNTV